MEWIYWIIGYVAVYLIARQVADRACFRLWAMALRQQGYVVVIKHRLTYSTLNARKQGEREIRLHFTLGWDWR